MTAVELSAGFHCEGVIHGIPLTTDIHNLTDHITTPHDTQIITNAYRLKNKFGRDSTAVLLKFTGKELPALVSVRGTDIAFPVQEYAAPPLRCFKCQGFGHKSQGCRGVAKCARCGGAHGVRECKTSTIKCPNCGGPHTSSKRGCLAYIRAAEVTKLMRREGMGWQKANSMVPPITSPTRHLRVTPPGGSCGDNPSPPQSQGRVEGPMRPFNYLVRDGEGKLWRHVGPRNRLLCSRPQVSPPLISVEERPDLVSNPDSQPSPGVTLQVLPVKIEACEITTKMVVEDDVVHLSDGDDSISVSSLSDSSLDSDFETDPDSSGGGLDDESSPTTSVASADSGEAGQSPTNVQKSGVVGTTPTKPPPCSDEVTPKVIVMDRETQSSPIEINVLQETSNSGFTINIHNSEIKASLSLTELIDIVKEMKTKTTIRTGHNLTKYIKQELLKKLRIHDASHALRASQVPGSPTRLSHELSYDWYKKLTPLKRPATPKKCKNSDVPSKRRLTSYRR